MEEKGKDIDDTKELPKENEVAFIHLLVGKVREGKLQSSTFKKNVWLEINNEMLDMIGVDYGIDMLKDFKKFKKQGCADYELLGEIFNTTTATGKLQQLSTKDPLSPDEERCLEEEFLSGSTHVDLGGNNSKGVGDKKIKKCNIQSIPVDCRSSKVNKMDKMDLFLEKWAATLNAKEEASKAKAERYKSTIARGSTSSNYIPDIYSIGICMDLLENMEGVSSCSYNKAIEKFPLAK
ncbi:hypothetical protein REPUB_Repub06bG0113500 [Reevesia pubescens]